jgi:hypothetical protein
MATSEKQPKKTSEGAQKPMNFAAFLKSVDTDRMTPANMAEKPLLLTNAFNRNKDRDSKLNARLLQATGVIISAIWLVGAALYVQRTVGWSNVSQLMPHELGGFLAGILTPIALFWMIAAFILRSNDVKLYADALREEIQSMIFPSDEANRRVNNDIERLIRQTSEMSKATKTMLASLNEARAGVRDQINELKGAGEDTVVRLGTLGQKLTMQSQEVIHVKDELESHLRGLETRTQQSDAIINKWSKANEDLALQAKTIDQTTATTENAIARLSDMLRERVMGLTDLHKETESALQNASSEIANQRQGLRVEAQALEEKAYSIAAVLDKSTDKLYNFTDDTLDKAKLIETRLLGQLSSIENVLSNTSQLSGSIEKATSYAAEHLERTANNAVERSQKVQGVLQDAVQRLEERSNATMDKMTERLAQASDRMMQDVVLVGERAQASTDEILASITAKVSDTTSSFASIQKQIQTLAQLFDERKGNLDHASTSARETAEALQATLQGALDRVHDTTKALQNGISSINSAVQQPFALLENASVLADQRAKELVTLLESKATTLTSAAAQIGGHVNTLHDQLHGKGQDVALLAGKIASHMRTVSDELNTQQTTLDDRITKSIEGLRGIGVELDAQGTRVATVSNETIATISGLNENLNKSVATLQNLTHAQNTLSEDLVRTESRISLVSDRFVHISGKTVDKIKSTLEDMTLLEADYHRLSEAGVENIKRLETGYRDSLANVQQATEQAATHIGASTQGLQGIATEISNAAEQAAVRIARVQETSRDAFGILQNISEKAQQADQDLNLVTSHVSVHINTISDAMKRAEEVTNNSVDRFVQQGQNLQIKGNEINNGISQTIENAGKFAGTMQHTLRQLRQETEGVEKTLSQTVGRLVIQNEQIDVSTTRLVDKIAQAHKQIAQQSLHIETTGDDIMARLQTATQTMGDRAAALEQAALSAQQQAEILRTQEAKLKRDTFFSSTKFVVESLHSLALDFTRLLEGELPEKTWKAYQKGDVGSFTRRMLSARDEETQGRIRTKFKDDLEFRTYAQRYLRQFEEIYDSAATNDYADLLTTVFITSDVGKLYQFLCTVLERDKRGTTQTI